MFCPFFFAGGQRPGLHVFCIHGGIRRSRGLKQGKAEMSCLLCCQSSSRRTRHTKTLLHGTRICTTRLRKVCIDRDNASKEAEDMRMPLPGTRVCVRRVKKDTTLNDPLLTWLPQTQKSVVQFLFVSMTLNFGFSAVRVAEDSTRVFCRRDDAGRFLIDRST